jgi:hypothetical protein
VVALLRNLRKTERGAGQFLVRLAVCAAPFALSAGRGSELAQAALLVSQSDHRIHAGGAARGQITGQQSDRG